MRIVLLTAGTGSFHCGTCMRDNALITEIRRQGHDALLVPLYLPMILDEESAAEGSPLFYGGINVYLQQKSGLFRATPRALDKILDSPGILRSAAKRAGMTSPRDLGEITISVLRGEEGKQKKELDRLASWLKETRPDVICLSNALLIGIAREAREQTGAAIVCTLQGEDTFLDSLPEPYKTQAWEEIGTSSHDVDAFTAVSGYHGDLMTRRAGLPPEKVHIVHNGIQLEGYEPAADSPNPPVLGYFARMCATKGLDTLVDAYIELRRRNRIPNLLLHTAGSQNDADARFVDGLKRRLESEGLDSDSTFLSNVDREGKIAFLQGISVLSVPATYGESFGLYVLEALAAGVPLVQPRHAAFPEILEETGGGILYDPDDPDALVIAIESLLADPGRARSLGLEGRTAVMEKFSVERMAERALRIFEQTVAITQSHNYSITQ